MSGQPARSGPPGNKNAVKHGYYALVKTLKKGDLERRTAIGRYQKEKEIELGDSARRRSKRSRWGAAISLKAETVHE